MTRVPAPPVTVALDPGVAYWTLRRMLRQAAGVLGTPPLDPVLTVTRPFLVADDAGLAAVRGAITGTVPNTRWLAYDLDGFTSVAGGTVGLAVRPSHLLTETSAAIESAIGEVATPADLPDERFLIPIARDLDRRPFRIAREALGIVRRPWYRLLFGRSGPAPIMPSPLRPLDATRLLVLVDGHPVGGYDLAGERWIARPVLGDRALQASSLRLYRRARGIECIDSTPRPAGETWFLADLHLGHPGIALHAARPFPTSETVEMDRVIVENWNASVAPGDRAILLGDLCAGPDSGAFRAAAASLAGRPTLVRGNHDPDLPELVPSVALEESGHRFLALHDPADAPGDFNGWVIHGHAHASDLRRYPFFDPGARRINVSVETAGYRPVPLSEIVGLVSAGAGRILVRDMPCRQGGSAASARIALA